MPCDRFARRRAPAVRPTSLMRAVLDTNILVSALLIPGGHPAATPLPRLAGRIFHAADLPGAQSVRTCGPRCVEAGDRGAYHRLEACRRPTLLVV